MTSNDAFFVTRPPCFLLHFFTDECIGVPSPDILNIAQWLRYNMPVLLAPKLNYLEFHFQINLEALLMAIQKKAG